MIGSGTRIEKLGKAGCKLDLQSSLSLEMHTIPTVIMKINTLREHEKIDKEYCERLKNRIKRDGIIKKAIAVDNNTNIVLDGHHRLNALRNLGCKMIPAILVDYNSSDIHVVSWRNCKVDKKTVINAGLTSEKLPPKTSKHFIITNGKFRHISYLEKIVNVPLSELV